MSTDRSEATKRLASLVPQGFDIAIEDDVAAILHGQLVVTVINLDLDIDKQVDEEICERHRVFCCPHCTDQSSAGVVRLD